MNEASSHSGRHSSLISTSVLVHIFEIVQKAKEESSLLSKHTGKINSPEYGTTNAVIDSFLCGTGQVAKFQSRVQK